MNYSVDQISGNSYRVILIPETSEERELLEKENNTDVSKHYNYAVKQKFHNDVRITSLTPQNDFPYSAIIELFSKSGSV